MHILNIYPCTFFKEHIFTGIDIKDIPNVNDHDFSVTLNGFFLVRYAAINQSIH